MTDKCPNCGNEEDGTIQTLQYTTIKYCMKCGLLWQIPPEPKPEPEKPEKPKDPVPAEWINGKGGIYFLKTANEVHYMHYFNGYDENVYLPITGEFYEAARKQFGGEGK